MGVLLLSDGHDTSSVSVDIPISVCDEQHYEKHFVLLILT